MADTSSKYIAAKRHVDAVKGFYIHALVFVCVMGGLFGLNAISSGGVWWVQWPALGWGAGLLAHWFLVFRASGSVTQDWEKRKIKEWMDTH